MKKQYHAQMTIYVQGKRHIVCQKCGNRIKAAEFQKNLRVTAECLRELDLGGDAA